MGKVTEKNKVNAINGAYRLAKETLSLIKYNIKILDGEDNELKEELEKQKRKTNELFIQVSQMKDKCKCTHIEEVYEIYRKVQSVSLDVDDLLEPITWEELKDEKFFE